MHCHCYHKHATGVSRLSRNPSWLWYAILLCFLLFFAGAPNAALNKTPSELNKQPSSLNKASALNEPLVPSPLNGRLVPSTTQSHQPFVIAHIPHPDIAPFKAVLKDIYQQLGIDVEFVAMPGVIGLEKLSRGLVDADLVRIPPTIAKFNNVLKLNPGFPNIMVVLVCQPGIRCDTSVLSDPSKTILSNSGIHNSIEDKHEINAQIVVNRQLDQTISFLRDKKAEYLIYGGDPTFSAKLLKEFDVITLAMINSHHVIANKHAHLQPKLEALLASRIHSVHKNSQPK